MIDNPLFTQLRHDRRTKNAIRGLIKRCYLLDPDDIEAEFWVGVIKGLEAVDIKIGDPLLYLIKYGMWNVRSAMRKELNKNIIQRCNHCGHQDNQYIYSKLCIICNTNMHSEIRYSSIDGLEIPIDEDKKEESLIHLKVQLTPQQIKALNALIRACNAGSTQPLTDAANELGISRPMMTKHVRTFRNNIELNE
jgi:hypothetical protein